MPAGAEHERGLIRLEPGQCWALLRTRSIGRLAVPRTGAGPLVVPVAYAVDGGTILFRTASGTKLDAALAGPVSFQVDDIDPAHRLGWSVLVDGTAVVAWAHGDEPLETWASWPTPFTIRVVPTEISGRELGLELLDTDARGYR